MGKNVRKRLSVLYPELKEAYDQVLKSYEENGIIVGVPLSVMVSPDPTYYMPHRPVIREYISTKMRPMFNASAPGSNSISPNDCLESGSSLIPDLVEILLKFRKWNVALTADVTKTLVDWGSMPDQDIHQFLWRCGNIVCVMRFVRVKEL